MNILPPCVILVEPQLDQNIGKVARAMMNFGLSDLRLVRPKTEWNNEAARRLSAGAELILENAKTFSSLSEAAKDVQQLYATTARPREMVKEVFTPHEASLRIYTQRRQENQTVGLVFGPERCGLENDDIALCKAIICVPLNPYFSSLNLAQAVVLVAYECYQADLVLTRPSVQEIMDPLATQGEFQGFFDQLEFALEKAGYFRAANRRAVMTRTLHNMFSRMPFTSQEVRTLRGVVSTLVNPEGIFSRPKKKREHSLES